MVKKTLAALLLSACFLLNACANQEAEPKLVPERPNETFQQEPIITLYQHETDQVIEIPLEEYLLGVVAAEMDTSWPKEALAAQAIMARTFTLEKIAAGGVEARGTDASTDIKEFQAYNAQNINDAVREAVSETKGKVIKYNDRLIKAWFFADGGGITAASSIEGLSYDKTETPYIQSVEDPGSQLPDNPNQNWEAAFSFDEVNKAVMSVTGKPLSRMDGASIVEKGPSGRSTQLQIGDKTLNATAFRLAIGSDVMKSTLIYDITVSDNQLMIKGSGYGHGVGMSQWGAKALAEQGKSAEEIITYFLKDVKIVKEYH